ncbi:hypothetical protein [Vibrio coralliilyticus]|uniref:hypothetical protein n=1 Tax=Vibrio coralliilyticus TaxID=190893 RepID=UPI001560B92B|nr:hypothetical protein [Vibrio coralliilyticus]NRF32774.1 hypothetical protein [Vibrio coralliilyticus]NRF55031.1 hypothetical protein [Vibrio coralliilyticus]
MAFEESRMDNILLAAASLTAPPFAKLQVGCKYPPLLEQPFNVGPLKVTYVARSGTKAKRF